MDDLQKQKDDLLLENIYVTGRSDIGDLHFTCNVMWVLFVLSASNNTVLV